MAIKNRKINQSKAIDAELVTNKPVPEDSAPLQAAINELSKQHTEKGQLAFELLKSLITGNASLKYDGTSYDTTSLALLTLSAFQLADAFKHEMDVRWSSAIADVVNKFQQPNDDSQVINKNILQ